jgi:SAP domain-containing ribonucleoprotein
VNRLQARLDEEEFGMVDPPSPLTTEAPKAKEGGKKSAVKATTKESPAAKVEEAKPAAEIVAQVEAPKLAVEGEVKLVPAQKANPTQDTSTTAASSSDAPMSMDDSFEEKKRQRAMRFGILAMQSTAKPAPRLGGKKNEATPKTNSKRQKTEEKKEEEPLLSLEEIEKQLERAQKFGTGHQAKIDELKAMKRKHRFNSNN